MSNHHPKHYTHHTTTHTSYPDTPSSRYFARLSEKAAPSGTIHLNSYDTSPSPRSYSLTSKYTYREPVYYAQPPERVIREREGRESERYGGREPVRMERVERVVREREVEGKGELKEARRAESRDGGIVGKGAGAIWRALGGR